MCELSSDKFSKQDLRDIAPKGWTWVYNERAIGAQYPEGFGPIRFYCFQTGSYADGFKVIRAKPEDMTKENLQRMADLGVTRV